MANKTNSGILVREYKLTLERDPVAIASRMVESFTSDLRAFVFDRNLIDSRIVDRIVSLSGYDGVLARHAQGTIIIYYIDTRKIRKKCLYEKCIDEDAEAQRKCLNLCTRSEINKIVDDLVISIIDIAKNLDLNE